MGAWSSSSLSASDTNGMRHSSGLLKHTPTRISKQHLTEQKMFGSKRKKIQIGKSFKKVGKGTGSTKSIGAEKTQTAKGISPSIAEFDKMMSKVAGKGSSKNKVPMFSRKQFG